MATRAKLVRADAVGTLFIAWISDGCDSHHGFFLASAGWAAALLGATPDQSGFKAARTASRGRSTYGGCGLNEVYFSIQENFKEAHA